MWGLIGIGAVVLVLLGILAALEPPQRRRGFDSGGQYEQDRFNGQRGYRNWRG